MRMRGNHMVKRVSKGKKLVMMIMLSFLSYVSYAQFPTDSLPSDPGAMTVYSVQDMHFGSFANGPSGGSVILSPSGSRTTTGTVLALNLQMPQPAIFEIEAPQGSVVSIMNGPNATLTGSNGGSMTLTIGQSSPASMFTTTAIPPTRTQVHIGGTLTVGTTATAPPGTYTGTFYVTFNLE
ncbi:DUF4402 domain-containing protein [Aridibaculum aurantiacum]|uniref:DUF4402 domain-containing protein n=1 Tax=Aridibaculum aurantiacum TaxID=2810307 RepID=UPI001A979DDB|nr:DUF4402 domain-containing protein [Aridibaculum aurantiacum]